MSATTPVHNRIALAFDFDETLAPQTTGRLLKRLGHDPDRIETDRVAPLLAEGWEPPLARTWVLTRLLEEHGQTLTESDLRDLGADYPLYPGVAELFSRVRDRARRVVPDLEVEFYLITAGFAEIPKGTPIAGEFTAIYGGAYHFDDHGHLATAKRLITHHEKTRYLLNIAKGLELDDANPNDVYQPVDPGDWHVPIDQMIFIGDGSSDLPAFKFMHEHGGIAIGVFEGEEPEDWDQHDKAFPSRRVENLAYHDYSEGGQLLESILLATDCITSRLALRLLGRGK